MVKFSQLSVFTLHLSVLKSWLPGAKATDPITTPADEVASCDPNMTELCYDKLSAIFLEQIPGPRSSGSQPSLNLDEDSETGSKKISVFETKIRDFMALDVDSVLQQPEPSPSPRFGMTLPLQMVANYGCWCYGGASWPTGQGRGQAKDQHDDACKAHKMGFDCIEMDAIIENKECVPTETIYDLTVVQPSPFGTIHIECANSIEDDWCKRRVCLVELRLLARYWRLINGHIFPNYALLGHPQSGHVNFDPLQNCPPIPGPAGADLTRSKKCCGDYPYRVWHYDYDAAPNQFSTQCCTYEDPIISSLYGFPITVGALYEQGVETCGASGPESLLA